MVGALSSFKYRTFYMNSLRLETLSKRLAGHPPLAEALRRIDEGSFPVDCSELEQPLAALMTAEAARMRTLLQPASEGSEWGFPGLTRLSRLIMRALEPPSEGALSCGIGHRMTTAAR